MAIPVALTIAGSDPSGGAGIQADLKTFHQFGVYGQAVITLLTVQNTVNVSRVAIMAADLVREQIDAVVRDIPPAAAKTGALGSAEVIEAVAVAAAQFQFPLIVDPVMVSKHGARLISEDAQQVLLERLLPLAFLVTPNIAEAEGLTGLTIKTEHDMRAAAERLREMGCKAVLLKGGHLTGEPVDILCFEEDTIRLPGTRVASPHTHGTGCTYAAAITACIARGEALSEAVRRAKRYVQTAIESAPGLGAGQGPVNHFASVDLSG